MRLLPDALRLLRKTVKLNTLLTDKEQKAVAAIILAFVLGLIVKYCF